jgi:hypothetical protein
MTCSQSSRRKNRPGNERSRRGNHPSTHPSMASTPCFILLLLTTAADRSMKATPNFMPAPAMFISINVHALQHQQGISSATARPEANHYKHGVRQDIFGGVKQPFVHSEC